MKYSKKAPLPRCHPLVHELFARIDALGVPLKTIAARTGCTPHVLTRWKLRNRPKLDNFDEVLQSMGLKLAIVEQ
jgi:hypothetical protein